MADSKPTSGLAPPPSWPSECVGRFDLSVVRTELSPEAAERWARRAEVLAKWLAAA